MVISYAPVLDLAAAALLLHGAEEWKTAPRLCSVAGDGVQLCKRGADEARHGRQIARQAQRAPCPGCTPQRGDLRKRFSGCLSDSRL